MTLLKQGILLMALLMTSATAQTPLTILGSPASSKTWVYLCGLAENLNIEQEVENRQILNDLGKELNIKFIALHPFDRCEHVNFKLCWRNYNPQDTIATYNKIKSALKGQNVAGFIGFSNGGYFLNELAQMVDIGCPVISVGAAGTYHGAKAKNKLTLIAGRQEVSYADIHKFYHNAQHSSLAVEFMVHDGDHILPEELLKQLLK
jgi:hypothetical protein